MRFRWPLLVFPNPISSQFLSWLPWDWRRWSSILECLYSCSHVALCIGPSCKCSGQEGHIFCVVCLQLRDSLNIETWNPKTTGDSHKSVMQKSSRVKPKGLLFLVWSPRSCRMSESGHPRVLETLMIFIPTSLATTHYYLNELTDIFLYEWTATRTGSLIPTIHFP